MARKRVRIPAPSSPLEATMSLLFAVHRLPVPVSELKFHPTRRWRFDFAWPAQMVACEVEGGTRQGGRHNRHDGFEADCEKYSEAAILGWRVVRVTADMVHDGRAIDLVTRALRG